jgi:hypothetical protein
MADVLMTICTYDDPAAAEEDAKALRLHGVQARVAPCLYEDPENPGVALVDLVVFDDQVRRAQDILGLLPPEWEQEAPSAATRPLWPRMLLALLALAGLTLAVRLIAPPLL